MAPQRNPKKPGSAHTKDLSCEIPERGSKAACHRVNEVDPLISPKFSGQMKVISVIENKEVRKKILEHLGLWDRKARPPPKQNAHEYRTDCSESQLPVSDNLSRAPRSNEWLYIDPKYPRPNRLKKTFNVF